MYALEYPFACEYCYYSHLDYRTQLQIYYIKITQTLLIMAVEVCIHVALCLCMHPSFYMVILVPVIVLRL